MSSVGYEAYQAKGAIAEAVIPILHEYKSLLISGETFSIPTWVVNPHENLTEEEMSVRWLEYVETMIKAFEIELKFPKTIEEILLQKAGLSLFAQYYVHLWD